MQSEPELLSRKEELTVSEMRSLNRYYLHPKNQRCCSKCFVVYDDYQKHFHIKKHCAGSVSFNTACARCFNAVNRKRIAAYRRSPHVFIRSKLTTYLHRARTVNTPFDLDANYLIQLWEQQGGKCYYTHEQISFEHVTQAGNAPHMLTPSLDRKDPKKGYTKGNVVWCSYGINRMKNEFDYETFLRACALIIKVSKAREH